MSDEEDTVLASKKLQVLKTLREDRFAELTSIRDNILSYSRTKFSLFEAKYNAAKEILKHANELKTQILQTNQELDQKNRLETSRSHTAFLQLFEVIEVTYLDVMDAKNAEASNTANQDIVSTPKIVPINQGVKLPSINIPPFENSIREFPKFEKLFDCVYGSNPLLSDSAKAYYLHSLLQGEALSLVSEFALDSQGYTDAWAALKGMYASERALASIHVTDIFSFTPLKKATGDGLKNYLAVHNNHVKSLKNLNIPDLGDFLLQELSARNLDPLTRRLFEQSLPAGTLPTHQSLMDFVSKQAHMLDILQSERTQEEINYSINKSENQKKSCNKLKTFQVSSSMPTSSKSKPSRSKFNVNQCLYCHSQSHKIYKCEAYNSATTSERTKWVCDNELCPACLGKGHNLQQCRSSHRCLTCGSSTHHSSLHSNLLVNSNSEPASTSANKTPLSKTMSVHQAPVSTPEKVQVLLGTLVANVVDAGGFTRTVRALVDTGSQKNLISLKAIKRLGLNPISEVEQTICGISDVEATSLGTITINLQSRVKPSVLLTIKASVLPNITSDLPATQLPLALITKFKHLPLADPHFGQPGQIDLLLNAEAFMNILEVYSVDQSSNLSNHNTLSTKFGTIVMGNIKCLEKQAVCLLTTPQVPTLLKSLERFWELEEVPPARSELTVEEEFVENHFVKTHTRDLDGRFVVRLPFKPDSQNLGWNRGSALASLYSLEKRLKRTSSHYQEYKTILANYVAQKHIITSLVKSPYVIPHHCVFKRDSQKLRIVFNASFPSSSGTSLNDTFYIGPSLQRDLSYVLMGFRIYPVALAADISAMYTNIAIHPDDSEKLHMFHLDNSDNLIESRLERLPFGLSCSPYLAIRCLRQVAIEAAVPPIITQDSSIYKMAREAILESFYVDDVLTGAFSLSEATNLREELVSLLAKSCFPLCKFKSNHLSLCSRDVDQNEELVFSNQDVKVLGLIWNPAEDALSFKTRSFDGPLSKRNILSYCSQLYDPLGLVNPVTLAMKLFIQELWRLKFSWDEILPHEFTEKWSNLITHIEVLSKCKIPRWVFNENFQHFLAIFCDGSQLAFGTCIYLVSRESSTGITTSNLLMAKSKVAPLKSKLTIPQIELSGMLLASKLWHWLKNGKFPVDFKSIHFFSDSTVALSWLEIEPSKLKVFVSNRVKQVLELSGPHTWHYVATKSNPADLVSRGLVPEKILNNDFWFHGPRFLVSNFPPREEKITLPECDLPDLRVIQKSLMTSNVPVSELELFEKYSSLTKLQRVFAYIKRFVRNSQNPGNAIKDSLTLSELNDSIVHLMKLHQRYHFSNDIDCLKRSKQVSNNLLALTPFLDEDGVVRVGGRLQQSNLEYDAKHPVILAKDSKLTDLVLKYYHAMSGHSGPSLSLALTRQKYWPISGRAAMRYVTKNCVICAKINANRISQPIMGDLPSCRIKPALAFKGYVAFDAAGPFSVKLSQRQTRQSMSAGKGYLLLWICLSTRAVHLEFMSSLKTESFLAAWDRMVSRRGIPSCCLSDQASNFKKGFRLIQEFSQFLDENKDTILTSLATRSIDWQFNVVYSPDKGGIWERQIGVAKRILKGLVTSQSLFFEEYSTLFAKVEALMNSRPYFPLSSDANDPLAFLTPAHFLIQSNFQPLPEPKLPLDMPLHRRWDRVRALTQRFWKIWSREYLQSRLTRNKWAKCTANLEIGQMVLVTDIQTSPATWPLGIVTSLIVGSQGAARVADIRTVSGNIRRSVNRLRLIPVVDRTAV